MAQQTGARPREREREMAEAFLVVARDTRLIPGVHHHCDEWCEMCAVTSRCLAYRCMTVYRKVHGRREGEPTFPSAADAMAFTRAVASLEGRTSEVEGHVRAGAAAGFKTSDPLAGTAWEYAVGVSMWLVLTPAELRGMRAGSTPSPEEVVLWHHLRIYIKLVRALVARDRPPAAAGRVDEINGSAKAALVSVQRSRKALLQLKKTPAGDTASLLVATLETLERGIVERFPKVHAYVRVGIDTPAG